MVSASAMMAPGSEPTREVLASVLQKLILVDKEGYFQMPVDEKLHHAPNYYIIGRSNAEPALRASLWLFSEPSFPHCSQEPDVFS